MSIEIDIMSGGDNTWQFVASGHMKAPPKWKQVRGAFKDVDHYIRIKIKKLLISPYTTPKRMEHAYIKSSKSDFRLWEQSLRASREGSS